MPPALRREAQLQQRSLLDRAGITIPHVWPHIDALPRVGKVAIVNANPVRQHGVGQLVAAGRPLGRGGRPARSPSHCSAATSCCGARPGRRCSQHPIGARIAKHRCRSAPSNDGCLTCAYHGWTFGDEGRCVRVPSASEGVPPPPRAHLDPYDCEERYGLVWVCLGVPRRRSLHIAQEDDPSFRRINTPVEVWQSSATRMVDNFLDITHFPFVHVGTFGLAQDTHVPRFELQPLDDGYYGYRYEVMANNTTGALVSGQTQQVVHREMSSGFSLPFVVRSTIRYDSGLEHILLLLSTPIDDVTSYFTFVVWRNDDFSVSAEEIIRFDLAIGAEDKRMLEQLERRDCRRSDHVGQRASRQVLGRVASPTRRVHQSRVTENSDEAVFAAGSHRLGCQTMSIVTCAAICR